jgi:hypothetical protein
MTVFGYQTRLVAVDQFTVADNSSYISGITPNTFSPNSAPTVTVTGSGFGAFGTGSMLSICHSTDTSCVSSDVTVASYNSWNNTQIVATLNAPSSASGFYDVQVTSAGVSGSGFVAAPSSPRNSPVSNRSSIAAQLSALSLVVKVGSTQLNAGQCAFIDPTPRMPQITAQLYQNGQPVSSGTATWKISITYQYWTRDALGNGAYGPAYRVPDTSGGTGDFQSLPANQIWTPTFVLIRGGNAVLQWAYNGAAGSDFTFQICGQNPSATAASIALQAGRPITSQNDGRPYWFAPRIVNHESGMTQFDGSGQPMFGQPAGYGMTQLDPVPSVDDIWDWTANVRDGLARMDSAAEIGYGFWRRQVAQWRANWASVTPPTETFQAGTVSCIFSAPFSGTTALQDVPNNTGNMFWFGDTEAMKLYAGAATGEYIYFDNTRTGNNPNPTFTWQWHRSSATGSENHNFPYEFCTCQNADATCQHHTTTSSLLTPR